VSQKNIRTEEEMESGDEVLTSSISLSCVFAMTFFNRKPISHPCICSELQQKGQGFWDHNETTQRFGPIFQFGNSTTPPILKDYTVYTKIY